MSVQERQAKAQQDIAAAKAREAAFAGQGTRQFTDTSVAQPVAPDFGLEDSSGGSATDTFELRDGGAQSEDDNPTDTFVLSPNGSDISSGGRQQSEYGSDTRQPLSGGSRADVKPGVDREQDAGEPGKLLDQSADTRTAANDTASSLPAPDRPLNAAIAGGTDDDTAAEPTDIDRPAPVYEADTSKPSYAQGRSDLKPQADDEQDGKTVQAELQRQTRQASSLRQPAAETAGDIEADTAAQDATTAAEGGTRAKSPFELQMQPQQTSSLMQPAELAAEGDMSAEPVYKADTSKPSYTQGRADLKPHADDEHDAREKAQAELQQKSKQKFTPDVSGYEAVRTVKTEGKPSVSPSAASSAAATSAALEQPAPVSKPMAGGRAPAGEHEAREKAMAEVKKESQQQQPVAAVSPDRAEAVKPQAQEQKQKQPLASERQPLSEQNQTQDLAKGLAGASMSAQPTKAQAQGQVFLSGERQPSPFQAQQATSSTSTSNSAGERQPSPFQAQQAASSSSTSNLAGERQPSPVQAQQAASSMSIADSAGEGQPSPFQAQQAASSMSTTESAGDRQPRPPQVQQAASSMSTTDSKGEGQPIPVQAQQAASSTSTSDSAGERQASPFQAQQAAISMSTAESAAVSLSPASRPQNPFQNLVSAFQGLLGGQASSSPTSSFARDQAAIAPPSPSTLSSAQQAQLTPADSSAAQRMAASSQSLAAGKGQAGATAGVPVKRYTEVTPEGDVTEFVRERGLRAPLLLLAGIAASAAQTLEPLWPVSLPA